jgi:hypothetical protein
MDGDAVVMADLEQFAGPPERFKLRSVILGAPDSDAGPTVLIGNPIRHLASLQFLKNQPLARSGLKYSRSHLGEGFLTSIKFPDVWKDLASGSDKRVIATLYGSAETILKHLVSEL